MSSEGLYWLVIGIVLAEFLYSTWLTLLNIKASHWPVPDLLKDLYDEDRYRKQQDYAMTNRKFSLISSLVSTLITLAIFAFGGFAVFVSYCSLLSQKHYDLKELEWVAISFFRGFSRPRD